MTLFGRVVQYLKEYIIYGTRYVSLLRSLPLHLLYGETTDPVVSWIITEFAETKNES